MSPADDIRERPAARAAGFSSAPSRPPRPAPARSAMSRLVENVLPGASASVRQLREEILDFALSLSARSLLLQGPIGVGKSTSARLISFLKRIAPLREAEAARLAANVRFDGPNRIDLRLMIPWFVEPALTGVVDTLAEAQLLGVARGAFTGAVERASVFEIAKGG